MGAEPSAARELGRPFRLLYLDRCSRAAKLARYRDVPPNGGHPAASVEWDTWGEGADGSTAVSGVGELPPCPHTLPSAETVFRPRLIDDRPEHTQREAFLSH
jgi:hypothetical protein